MYQYTIIPQNTCCFTGHRRLPEQDMFAIRRKLRQVIEQLIDNIPEGEYYIKQKPIIKVPEGQWWFSVEGGAGEFGVYLDSRGDKSPYRVKMRPMGLTIAGAFDKMLQGQKIADLVATGAAVDFVIPDLDR